MRSLAGVPACHLRFERKGVGGTPRWRVYSWWLAYRRLDQALPSLSFGEGPVTKLRVRCGRKLGSQRMLCDFLKNYRNYNLALCSEAPNFELQYATWSHNSFASLSDGSSSLAQESPKEEEVWKILSQGPLQRQKLKGS